MSQDFVLDRVQSIYYQGMRLALVLGLAIACSGGKGKPPATAGSGSQALYAKKVSVALAISGQDVFLQVTDETGKQTSYPLGTYQGECKVMTPAKEMNALTGVTCTGVEIDVTTSGQDIIVLKGDGTDPMARQEVTRVTAPGGAAVVFGQQMIGTVIAAKPRDCKNTPPPLTETNVECVQQYCENHVSECVNRYSNLKLR